MKPTVKSIAGQPSWILRSDEVALAVTQLGGHMAPVTFHRKSARPVQPYYVSPWQGEDLKTDVPVLVPLRGDFFCMPFGIGCTYQGERHVLHGKTATGTWRLTGAAAARGVRSLQLTMKTRVRPGKVTKRISLLLGQNVVYVQHRIEGFAGPTTLGHHATLAMPAQAESVLVATSPIRFGMTNPVPTSDPAGGEYQSLAVGAKFDKLTAVPLIWSDPTTGDCSRFPTRKGFTDLAAVFNKPAKIAWTTATFTTEGFLWFSLKDPAVLPATLLWIANHGRHQSPWDGRNACLGLEDVCGYFAEGLAPSVRENALKKAGVPTTIRLSAKQPTDVNYIEGVVQVPRGFGKVTRVRFAPGEVTFATAKGQKVTADVRHNFLATGRL